MKNTLVFTLVLGILALSGSQAGYSSEVFGHIGSCKLKGGPALDRSLVSLLPKFIEVYGVSDQTGLISKISLTTLNNQRDLSYVYAFDTIERRLSPRPVYQMSLSQGGANGVDSLGQNVKFVYDGNTCVGTLDYYMGYDGSQINGLLYDCAGDFCRSPR